MWSVKLFFFLVLEINKVISIQKFKPKLWPDYPMKNFCTNFCKNFNALYIVKVVTLWAEVSYGGCLLDTGVTFILVQD